MQLYAPFFTIVIPLALMVTAFACLIVTRKDKLRNRYARAFLALVFAFSFVSRFEIDIKSGIFSWPSVALGTGAACYAAFLFIQLSRRREAVS
jgi:hypothetical protein